MNIFQGPLWDTVLQVLRDPIFALIFSIVLAILAARAVQRVVKGIFYISALVVFIWLVTNSKPFADVCIAIVSAVFNILLVLIVVVAIVCIVAVVCVFIMFVISKPSSYRSKSLASWNDFTSIEEPREALSRSKE